MGWPNASKGGGRYHSNTLDSGTVNERMPRVWEYRPLDHAPMVSVYAIDYAVIHALSMDIQWAPGVMSLPTARKGIRG